MRLVIDQLEVVRGGRRCLGPLDLTLDLQGITVITGHNGAGKSLLLRALHGLIPPTKGRVLWNGVPAIAGRKARGFVFQTPPLLRRSVLGNAMLATRARGLPRSAARGALERVGLSHRAAQPAATLSGGERQRLALAQALAGGPCALLLDEPSASLDRKAAQELAQTLANLNLPMLLATHDTGLIDRLATRIVTLEEGRLRSDTI